MNRYETDILIVGSGAGAAGLVSELKKGNQRITVVERARKDFDFGKGLEERGRRIYQPEGAFPKSKEGVIFYYHHGLGGTLEASCANGVPPSPTDCANIGIDIKDEVDEIMNELGVNAFPDSHLGKNAELMISASHKIGKGMQPMPKFIDFHKCIKCGMCETICQYGAKWSTRDIFESLEEQNKITILDDIRIEKIEMQGHTARAAIGTSSKGPVRIEAKSIILTAGAAETPVILQNSGFEAGSNFFLDLFVIVYGRSKRFAQGRSVPMPAFYLNPDESFVVSPYMDVELSTFLYERNVAKWFKDESFDGLMIKIKDEPGGRVNSDGTINKHYTEADKKAMQGGIDVATEILLECGAARDSILTTSPRGAHPGGTAAIGTVVGNDLKVTGSNNLYVADASVLPKSPGKPPIVSIMALAKKLGKSLNRTGFSESDVSRENETEPSCATVCE